MTEIMTGHLTMAPARMALWAHNASDSLEDFVDKQRRALRDPETDNYNAVLVAVIVLLGVFVVVGALYLYLCTRAGYSRVSVDTRILKKWGVPYGIKGYIYCS